MGQLQTDQGWFVAAAKQPAPTVIAQVQMYESKCLALAAQVGMRLTSSCNSASHQRSNVRVARCIGVHVSSTHEQRTYMVVMSMQFAFTVRSRLTMLIGVYTLAVACAYGHKRWTNPHRACAHLKAKVPYILVISIPYLGTV